MTFPTEKQQMITLEGPVGFLEAMTTYPQDQKPVGTAVICHPHPLHGGTMLNKVVTTLAKVFDELGYCTVRFNYRGVGQSDGEFANAIGESEDAQAVVDWVKQHRPEDEVAMVGFSFGGYVAARVALNNTFKLLLTVAPMASRFDELDMSSLNCPWYVVQGDQDEVIDGERVLRWPETMNPAPNLLVFEGAGHFFHGRLVELRKRLCDCLK